MPEIVAPVTPTAAAPAQAVEIRHAQVKPLTFAELEGWQNDDHAAAFAAYMKSCGAILASSTAMRKARPMFGGLYNACGPANAVAAGGAVDAAQARKFFEDNFKPVRILPAVQTYGFYTGADGFYT